MLNNEKGSQPAPARPFSSPRGSFVPTQSVQIVCLHLVVGISCYYPHTLRYPMQLKFAKCSCIHSLFVIIFVKHQCCFHGLGSSCIFQCISVHTFLCIFMLHIFFVGGGFCKAQFVNAKKNACICVFHTFLLKVMGPKMQFAASKEAPAPFQKSHLRE